MLRKGEMWGGGMKLCLFAVLENMDWGKGGEGDMVERRGMENGLRNMRVIFLIWLLVSISLLMVPRCCIWRWHNRKLAGFGCVLCLREAFDSILRYKELLTLCS